MSLEGLSPSAGLERFLIRPSDARGNSVLVPVFPIERSCQPRFPTRPGFGKGCAAEIASLPGDMQARFLRLSDRIGQAGLESLGEPHVKHLEGKLWELRLTGRDGIARALYVTAIGRRVVVVRAFVKKSQKTRPAEIKLALRRAKEIT